MNGTRVLVTGGSGFIGQYLMAELRKRGAIVIGTCIGYQHKEDFVPVTLFETEKLKSLIEEFKPDWIVHLAAIALVTHGDIEQIYGVNVLGTENLFNAVLSVDIERPKMLLASTAGVYGNQDAEYLHEGLPYNPANHYSYSKMVMEMLAERYRNDITIHIVRPFNVIGAGQAESFLVPKIVRHYFDHKPVLQLGNIDSVRDYVEAKRSAWMISELMSRGHQEPFTVNLCSGRGWTGHDVLDYLEEISGFRPKIEIANQYIRKDEVWRLVGDPSLLTKYLGQEPKLPDLKTILASMYSAMV
ncbi:NAD-dependent epimerase/dehydratase family protein [Yersinia sp. HM-2024]|uniref:NAD-dependent epimerase/dehydratase family protein n=1 Tax=Yersinia sp. HM-2024 TaxID=3344550 RepID=UPI00370D5AE5